MPSKRLSFFHACTAVEHKIDIGEPERMKVNLSLAGIFGNCCYFQIFVQFTRRVSWNIYVVNQAVQRGVERQKVQPGSVTFIQRFGSALNANTHFHFIVIEGVFLDRTDQGLKPRFIKVDPPSDADIANVVQTISRRVVRKLRQLGYLEAGLDDTVATGYDPLRENEPELARAMAASVKQRITFGERSGQKVRRIGSGFGNEGERPELKGPRCASVNGFSLHANTHIPRPLHSLSR